jgi:hypothetical protein
MPPFTRKSESAPELGRSAVAAHTLADGLVHAEPVSTTAALPITDREADLRTLKHYLYHAGLLVEKLLADDSKPPAVSSLVNIVVSQVESDIARGGATARAIEERFTRDRDATGA